MNQVLCKVGLQSFWIPLSHLNLLMQKQKFSFNISLILSMAKFFICENSDLWKIKLITSRSWIKMTVEYCRIFLLVFNWLTYFPCWYMTIRLNFALVWLLTAYIYCANYYWNKICHSLFRKMNLQLIQLLPKEYQMRKAL